MKKVHAIRSAVAAAILSTAQVALATGDSGTAAAGEMQVSGATFAMMVGALVGLGVVVWLVTKMFSK
jgi:hypothetical protein